mmetsp:Transcript_27532/g.65587  ORF Transcript_27532/g.65587 Transcript_27532/m.65587 type:complete len:294 (-) Transcript_27532:693-1574(-)
MLRRRRGGDGCEQERDSRGREVLVEHAFQRRLLSEVGSESLCQLLLRHRSRHPGFLGGEDHRDQRVGEVELLRDRVRRHAREALVAAEVRLERAAACVGSFGPHERGGVEFLVDICGGCVLLLNGRASRTQRRDGQVERRARPGCYVPDPRRWDTHLDPHERGRVRLHVQHIVPRDHSVKQRDVSHAQAHRAHGVRASEGNAALLRVAALGWPHARDAAHLSGNAEGAGRVGAEATRRHARRDCCGRPVRAASRVVPQRMRVPAVPRVRVVSHHGRRELGHVCLGNADFPGLL